MALTRHAGFTIPGFSYGSNWNQPIGTAIPGQIKAIGGNWAALQTQYDMASNTATDITTTYRAVPDAGMAAMAQACRDQGLKICLKPHVIPAGNPQAHVVPGAFYVSNGAHYSSGQNALYVPSASFDSSWVGRRVITPTSGHYNEIPSGLNTLGTAAPTWTTITSVTDSTHAVMSANATASSGNATIVIPDDTAVATWFSQYTAIVDHLLSVITNAGCTVDMLDLIAEHDFSTLIYDTQWRGVIAHYRSLYPNMQLTISMAGNDGYGNVCFWNLLDTISITFYPIIQATQAGGETYQTIENNLRTYVSGLSALSAAWGNKPILLGEMGFRSIVGAGYNPWTTGQTVVAGQSDQWACCQAFFRVLWNQPWMLGFHWWVWAFAQPDPSNELTSYSPNTKQCETAFSQFLGAVPSRLITDGTASYRTH